MTKHIALPPVERLNELLEIVPIAPSQFKIQSGLVWRVKRNGTKGIGSVAGSKVPNLKTPGRFDWRVKVDGRQYYVSRVIYFMANGVDPGEFEVDHKDQNPMNNNVDNLRLGGDSLQQHNQGTYSNNTSGAKGVHLRANGKWQAQLTHKREHFYLGTHTCLIEAARAYNNKIIELELDKIGKPLHDLEALNCDCEKCL
jgi:hypothetical protein